MRKSLIVLSMLLLVAAGAAPPAGAQRPRTTTTTATRRVVANSFPGADLGAKINAADASLGASPGEIVVNGGGTILTQVVINSGHTLRFSAGTFVLQTKFMWEGAILLKARTSVIGAGWQTVIVEPPQVGWTVFQSYEDIRSKPAHSGVSSDITVTDLKIMGANPAIDGGVRQTISLANCHRCRVENVWLDGTGVIGVQAGGNAAAGNFADGVVIRKNLFTRVASQAVALVNGRNVLIEENTFKESGRAGAPSMSTIDLEPNDATDIIRNVTIRNNLIDSRNSPFLHGNGILVQNAVKTSDYGPVLVEGNTIIGGDFLPHVGGLIASGIYLIFVQNVRVVGNTVKRVAHSGIRVHGGSDNVVANNTIVSAGTGGILAFMVMDSARNQITDNDITIDPNSPMGTIVIEESGAASRDNVYRGNRSGRTPLRQVKVK